MLHRSWRLVFSRERVATASFTVRAQSAAALAAVARRFLPVFPDVRHIVLRWGGGGGAYVPAARARGYPWVDGIEDASYHVRACLNACSFFLYTTMGQVGGGCFG